MRLRTRISSLVAALMVGGLLASCSTGPTEGGGSGGKAVGTAKPDASAFPVTIKHAFGETTIKKPPKRVATLGWSDQDHVASLGVVPVGAVKITWGGNEKKSSDWFDKKVAELGGKPKARYDDADGAPVDEIAQLAPDVILATNSGLTKKEYQKLSKIAPVVAYPENPWTTPWQTSLEMVGKALGLSKRAEKVEAETQARIDAAKKEYPEIVGKSLIFGYISSADLSQIGIYAPQDPRVSFMHDLGMVDAPAVEKAIPKGKFYGEVSAEDAADLNSEVFLTWADTPKDAATFKKDKLISQVPAIDAGHSYAEADQETAYAITNPNPLSIPVIIDRFVPKVAKAANGS